MIYNISHTSWWIISGDFIKKSDENLVIFFHGFTTDKSSSWRFDDISHDVDIHTNWSIFRFDFMGCWESGDWIISFGSECEDAQQVLRHFIDRGYTNIVIYGHSMWGTIALMVYPFFQHYIQSLILSGPAVGPMCYNWEEYVGNDLYAVWSTQGYIELPSKCGRKVKVSYDIMKDFASINTEMLAKSMNCPICIIHGNHPDDTEESELLEYSKKFISLYNKWKLIVLDGAKHTMMGYNEDISKIITQALSKSL